MKKHTTKKVKKKRNGNGNGNENWLNQRLCLFYDYAGERPVDILAVNTRKKGFFRLPDPEHPERLRRMGFATLGNKVFLIGGESVSGETEYPKLVYVYNLGKDKDDHKGGKWEKGPQLLGGKPDPMVATVNRKIYALAGMSLWHTEMTKQINPVFEVFDPESNGGSGEWTALADPPFISLYQNYGRDLAVNGFTVIGSNIYVRASSFSKELYNPSLYAFNVSSETWWVPAERPDITASDKFILDNLIGPFEMYPKVDVVDYMVLDTRIGPFPLTKGLKVFAIDLAATVGKQEDFYSYGYLSYIDGDEDFYTCLAIAPVHGLSHLRDKFHPTMSPKWSVIHCGHDIFCLICVYYLEPSEGVIIRNRCHLYVCTFRVEYHDVLASDQISVGRSLSAKILWEDDYCISEKAIGRLKNWGFIPNEGVHYRIRRPGEKIEARKLHSCDDPIAGLKTPFLPGEEKASKIKAAKGNINKDVIEDIKH